VNVFGGTLSGDILALASGIITISGSGFNFPFGDLVPLSGTLTGVLSDGTPLNVNFGRASTATITLIPEPTTGLFVVGGLVGMAASSRRRRVGRRTR
jgi:hypothetical protein